MVTIAGIGIPLVWLHLASLAYTLVVVLLADNEGIKWMKGSVLKLDNSKIKRLHTLVWVGLFLMILTGLVLFWPAREYLLLHLPFQIKMVFVLVLIVNGFLIGKLSKTASKKEYKELTKVEKSKLVTSGALSFIGWVGAIVAATFINL